jgi:hypothetical protein
MRLATIFKNWLPIAVVVTALCGLVYVAVQQVLRQEANDPQIQIAEDAAAALAGGQTAQAVVPSNTIDVGQSLSPFVMVFDSTGKVIASSGQLHGQAPNLPAGVLDYVKQNGEDRLTWQPEAGVRIASVTVPYTGATSGYVLAGRSLREVEVRESQTEFYAGAVWVAALLGTLVAVAVGEFILGRSAPQKLVTQ